MSIEHKTMKSGGKRHISSSDDSSNSPLTDVMTLRRDMASPPDDHVATPSDRAVTNQTKVALVKKLTDSSNQESPTARRGRTTSPCAASPKVISLCVSTVERC